MGIHELLEVVKRLDAVLPVERFCNDQSAVQHGMKTSSKWKSKGLEGLTSVEEILRVTAEGKDKSDGCI